MPGPEPTEPVNAVQTDSSGAGILVPIARSQLREAGIDPDADIKVNRFVYDSERAEMRLRFYER